MEKSARITTMGESALVYWKVEKKYSIVHATDLITDENNEISHCYWGSGKKRRKYKAKLIKINGDISVLYKLRKRILNKIDVNAICKKKRHISYCSNKEPWKHFPGLLAKCNIVTKAKSLTRTPNTNEIELVESSDIFVDKYRMFDLLRNGGNVFTAVGKILSMIYSDDKLQKLSAVTIGQLKGVPEPILNAIEDFISFHYKNNYDISHLRAIINLKCWVKCCAVRTRLKWEQQKQSIYDLLM